MPRERLYWISQSGTSTDLTDWDHYYALRERMGFWSPQYTVRGFEIPGQAGSVVQLAKAINRVIEVPMVIRESNNNALRERLRDLSHLLIASNGDGRLLSVDEDGERREIYCRYLRGLESGREMPASLHTTLTFQASDPYWYSTTYTELTMAGGSSTTYWFPIFPLKLSNSLALGINGWENDGDEEAWPIWTITGPASSIEVSSYTSLKRIKFEGYTLANNTKKIIVDTRPGYKTVEDQDGTNLMGYLTSNSSLFPILVGTNYIEIIMTGTTPQSNAKGKFKKRYLSA